MFENRPKSHIQHCERNELYLLFDGQKLIKNAKNGPFWRVFWKPGACGQAVITRHVTFSKPKFVKNAKFGKLKMGLFGWFSNFVQGTKKSWNHYLPWITNFKIHKNRSETKSASRNFLNSVSHFLIITHLLFFARSSISQKQTLSTMFKNYSKCRIGIFNFWHFSPIFVLLKVTCLVTLFDRKLQILS